MLRPSDARNSEHNDCLSAVGASATTNRFLISRGVRIYTANQEGMLKECAYRVRTKGDEQNMDELGRMIVIHIQLASP